MTTTVAALTTSNPPSILRPPFNHVIYDDNTIREYRYYRNRWGYVGTAYTAQPGTTYAGSLVSQWINSGSANLYGFEVAYQQRLAFLPGPLAGLGMLANYSWTASQLNHVPGRPDSPALQRQTPNCWNLSPTWDRGRFSVRVGYSYNGPCIYQYEYQSASDVSGLGPHGPTGDVYSCPTCNSTHRRAFARARDFRP